MSKDIIEIDDDSFRAEVVDEQKPVLVDFWASWCGPCLMMAPAIEKIAEEFRPSLKVCKLNIDNNRKIPSEFGIMSIPTLILFKGGKEATRIIGALSERELARRIKEHIG